MPQCAFINCRNNHRNTNSSDGISFFSFPNNPFRREEWGAVVARERRDPSYKPSKRSVICSNHFEKCDITENTERKRLVNNAVPKLQIEPKNKDGTISCARPKQQITSEKQAVPPLIKVEFTEEEPLTSLPIKKEIIEDDPEMSPRIKIEIDEENSVISEPTVKEVTEKESAIYPGIKIEIDDEYPLIMPRIKEEVTKDDPWNTTGYHNTSSVEPNLIPVSRTPKEIYLQKQLNKCRKIIIEKSRRIQNLQKVNKRLIKKNGVLKSRIKILQKRKTISDIIFT